MMLDHSKLPAAPRQIRSTDSEWRSGLRLGEKTMRVAQVTAATAALLIGFATFQGRLLAEPATTSRLDWLFDGEVGATVRVGDVLYAGGSFRSVSPVSGALGTFFQLSPSTGAPLPGLPIVNGDISVVAPDGAGGYFLSGQFTNIGRSSGGTSSTGRFQLAHVLADGSVDPAFGAPQVSGSLSGIVRVGASVVVTGFFTVNGVYHSLLALDPATGALTPWVADLPPVQGREPSVPAAVGANGVLYVLFIGNSNLGRRIAAIDGTTGATLWTSPVVGPTGLLPGGLIAVSAGRVLVTVDRLYALDAATGAIDPIWGAVNTTGITSIVASGNEVVVGGSFTALVGQPRTGLGAIDVTTGQATAWNPNLPFSQAAVFGVSPTGDVFVGGVTCTTPPTGCSSSYARVNQAGAATPWTPQLTIGLNIRALLLSSAGNVVVATQQISRTGTVSRLGLAAFDAVTGALVASPTISGILPGGAVATTVDGLAARGSTLYVSGTFTSVNGVARAGMAAVDTVTGSVLPWAPSAPARLAFAFGPDIYAAQFTNSGPFPGNAWILRRLDGISGVADPGWQPPSIVNAMVDRGRIVAARDTGSGPGGGAAVGELDLLSGAFGEWWRTPAISYSANPLEVRPVTGRLAVDGDTVYLAGPRPEINYINQRDVAEAVVALDRRTGVTVGPQVQGYINGVTIADGHAIVSGGRIIVNGVEAVELAELAQPGSLTSWRPAWPLFGAPVFFDFIGSFNYLRGALGTVVAGDLLIVRGLAAGDPTPYRVTGYPLSGPTVPNALRTQVVGATTVFSWDPMATAPPSGYVIEGGFARGQTAAALPVGGATGVALAMPAGPLFIRVRAQGSTETSNEIVAGCVAPPLPPTALTAGINGAALTLTWTAPSAAVTTYTLVAGSTAGASNVATLSIPGSQTSVSGPVSGGTFFVRALATNACGTSGPSGEVFFTMGAPDPLPAAPTNLAATITGQTVSLSWTGPAAPITGYLVEAGTAPGLANLGALRLGPASSVVLPGVPSGAYTVRVRAVTSAGSGAPSADIIVVVP